MNGKDDKEFVDYIQSYFKQAYQYTLPFMERKDMIQRAFDGEIDSETWSTLSEINIPLLRTAVLQAVPFVVNYLFPNSNFIELIPTDESVPFDAVRRVEDVLENELIYKMKIKKPATIVVQDAIKFGCGYAEVKRTTTTQPSRELVRFFQDGEVKSETPRMTSGVPTDQAELRWLPYETVIPTPDGDSPSDVTCVFHIDSIREDQLRAMFAEDNALPSDERVLSGSVDDIIDATRSGNLDGGFFPYWWIASSMTGDNNQYDRLRKMNEIQKLTQEYAKHKAPVIIPVLKCYFKGEHVWLANGDTIIYHIEGGLETMACPIIKANSAIDGGNWFAQSDVSASKDVSDGIITFKNAMMDLLTYHLHPTTIYNEQAMAQANKMPDIEPYSKVGVLGVAGDAISYLQPPQIAPAIVQLGQVLEQDHAVANGQPLQNLGQGGSGLMRGGGGAFESLMQSTMVREEFLGVLMEMDFMEPVIQQTLLQMQMMNKEEFSFVSKKDQEYLRTTTTQSEIRNAFDVHVNLKSKLRGGINEESMAIARYVQVYRGNIYVDQGAALETVHPDKEVTERLLATPEQVKSNIENAQKQEQASMGGTQGEQAVMGGASQRAGVNG